MGKEIITHFDNGGQLPACGVWGYVRMPVTVDRDEVTCMKCKRTHLFRGTESKFYAAEAERLRSMDNAGLIAELGRHFNYLWNSRDRAKRNILISEIRSRMSERRSA